MRKHGMYGTPEHIIWRSMLQRCRDRNSTKYTSYGGRGISICDRWLIFENFLTDMGHRPTPHHSIDRIDNDGNYCPENCRWATQKQQARNKRRTIRVEIEGTSIALADYCEANNLNHAIIRQRIARGTPIEIALQAAKIKPRVYSGDQHWQKKLTSSAVAEIKQLLSSGLSQQKIGERFGVSQTCIHYIATGKQWRSV